MASREQGSSNSSFRRLAPMVNNCLRRDRTYCSGDSFVVRGFGIEGWRGFRFLRSVCATYEKPFEPWS